MEYYISQSLASNQEAMLKGVMLGIKVPAHDIYKDSNRLIVGNLTRKQVIKLERIERAVQQKTEV